MVLKFSKIFVMPDAITQEPITLLVNLRENQEGDPLFSLKTLEGEYGSARDFEASYEYNVGRWERGDISTRKEVKLWTHLIFGRQEFSQLSEAIKEAIAASGEET